MKLRQKPKKPESSEALEHLGNILHELEFDKLIPIKQILDLFTRHNKGEIYVKLLREYGYYGDLTTSEISLYRKYLREPTKEELQKYELKLKQYNKWYEKNKVEIEAYLKEREEKKKIKKEKDKQAQIDQLLKNKKYIEKELEKLNK